MKHVMLGMSFATCLAIANPVMLTYLSEFSTTPGNQWVELHLEPEVIPLSITDWRIVTPASACTLMGHLDSHEYLVIDSAQLARRDRARGTLRLDPAGDSFLLIPTLDVPELVRYPALPTGEASWTPTVWSFNSPAPSPGASAAFWDHDDPSYQSFNWYVDSTPTPGNPNDDWSSIAGTVKCDSSRFFSDLVVSACGQFGRCHWGMSDTSLGFVISGLGPGRYRVEATARDTGRREYRGVALESVYVGYSETRPGVDIDLVPYSVEETREDTRLLPVLDVRGRVLSVAISRARNVELDLYDAAGRRVLVLERGLLAPGRHEFDLSRRVPDGAWFARLTAGSYSRTVKVLVAR